jgi:hypothetical protein
MFGGSSSTNAANVFLVDPSNYTSFKAGRGFTYYGGLIERTPHDLVIPRAGRWYIVAHSWGLRYPARISVEKLSIPRAMPKATPSVVDLRSIAENAATYASRWRRAVQVERSRQ